ncbi:MAG TPA: hypothetical protein VID48_09815 [Solirubrobacteraceae bacterium]
MTDFLDQKRKEITNRLAELEPLVDEYRRLEAAASALERVGGKAPVASAPSAPRKRPGRPRGSSTRAKATVAAASKRTPGRRKGSGTRAAQTVSFVKQQPGITIPQLASKMGIKQNYLYRVLPGLAQEGKISKVGRGWHPAG